ncbi:hypothetical protein AY599_08660 [Leptolyngbya valderiana BDU 20041]|nr:hypothetical protein AY599_08660 [Leptolyngbya valderiana BDU 20041]
MTRADLDVWIYTPESTIGIQRVDLPGGLQWLSDVLEPLPDAVDPEQSPWAELESGRDPRPEWSRPDYPGYMRSLSYFASGWPARAAEGRRVSDQGPSSPVERLEWLVAVDLSPEWFAWVPLRPIWFGVLANTLFYAAIALMPMVLLRWRRTRRRRARGLCVACGYELGEGVSVCSECGLVERLTSRTPRVSEGA